MKKLYIKNIPLQTIIIYIITWTICLCSLSSSNILACIYKHVPKKVVPLIPLIIVVTIIITTTTMIFAMNLKRYFIIVRSTYRFFVFSLFLYITIYLSLCLKIFFEDSLILFSDYSILTESVCFLLIGNEIYYGVRFLDSTLSKKYPMKKRNIILILPVAVIFSGFSTPLFIAIYNNDLSTILGLFLILIMNDISKNEKLSRFVKRSFEKISEDEATKISQDQFNKIFKKSINFLIVLMTGSYYISHYLATSNIIKDNDILVFQSSLNVTSILSIVCFVIILTLSYNKIQKNVTNNHNN